jgi:hypothetical protein
MNVLPVANLLGYYVSDTGVVFGPRGQMTPKISRNGGHYFLYLRGKNYFIHHLVLQTFVSPRPEGLLCRHLDGDCTNNNVSNLAWGTPRENYNDCIKHGSNKKPPPPDLLYGVKFLRQLGLYQTTITSVLGIPQQTVSKWLNYV